MVFSNTWILSLKIVLISSGVVSMALLFKTSVPAVMEFSSTRAPVPWSSFLSWLKPPYLYVIINGIIIGIVASSRFYKNDEISAESQADSSYEPKMKSDFVESRPDLNYELNMKSDFGGGVVYEGEQQSVATKALVFEEEKPVFAEKSAVVVNGISVDATWTPLKRTESPEIPAERGFSAEKPPASARFSYRKPVKASPEGGRALRVTKPKRHDTLENTWKTITEGRSMPLTRHLKKSDTWENPSVMKKSETFKEGTNYQPAPVMKKSETFKDGTNYQPAPVMKKSETFKDRTNYQPPPVDNNSPASAGKLKKEPSLGQDELNRRVEAFIKKFNEEMRLQRQESLRQYQEMIGRGV